MDIIIFYYPEYFSENRDQIAYYMGSKTEKFHSFIANIDSVDALKKAASEIYINWRQSGSPEDCIWVPILYQIMKKSEAKETRRFLVKKGGCGFRLLKEGVLIYFKKEVPKKSFIFNL